MRLKIRDETGQIPAHPFRRLMALRLVPRSAAFARALMPRASLPVKMFKKLTVQDRSFQTCKPAFAKGVIMNFLAE